MSPANGLPSASPVNGAAGALKKENSVVETLLGEIAGNTKKAADRPPVVFNAAGVGGGL